MDRHAKTFEGRPWPWTWIALSLVVALTACSDTRVHAAVDTRAPGYETAELRYQGSTGQVLYPELAEDLGYLAPLRLAHIGNTISGPQDIQTVATGDVDFGAAFNGSIINLIAAGAPITAVVGLSFVDEETWSGFYVLDGSPIQSGKDFIGKKVGMNTVGAHSEFMLKEYLMRKGLDREQISQVTMVVIPPVNSEQALRQKQVDVATLGGILRDKALERGGLHFVFRDYDLFGRFTSASYAMSKSFLRDNPKSARKFVEATARAIEWTRTTPLPEVHARLANIIARRGRNEDATLLKYFRPSRSELRGGLMADDQFQVWIDWLVKDGQLVTRQIKPRDIYTNRLNPMFEATQ
jgi:ABC-type nitrate/sulfonate/bicarbonate transport system substrate-binding protein